MVLSRALANPVYVRIRPNSFDILHIDTGERRQVTSSKQFSTKRLLVAEFAEAERCLRAAAGEIFATQWFRPAPVLVMHPLEMVEGGLSSVEERVLLELAKAVGSRKGVVWVGKELTIDQVKDLASGT